MGRKVNKKCQQCAALSVEDAIALHGPEGDDCWNPGNSRQLGYDCHRRRNHYRYRDDDNRKRRRVRKLQRQAISLEGSQRATEAIELAAPEPPNNCAAVLVIYRNGRDTPAHAVAAEVWRASQKIAEMKPTHCMGMRGDEVVAYIQKILAQLREAYGVGRFEDVIKEVPVSQCPVAGCPFGKPSN